MNWSNSITQKLDIVYPIVQAPMFGVTTPEMVAAATKANCLGSLPLGNLSASECINRIKETKQLTERQFSVNIFVNEIPEISDELKNKFRKAKALIERLAYEANLELILPDINEIEINDYRDQIDAIISENCRILSFTFGIPDAESIEKLKSHGVILIGTCTSVREAETLEEAGIDLICVQGMEAGGHQGYFEESEGTRMNGSTLLSSIIEKTKLPIIYAGGIKDGESLVDFRNRGAQAFQIGSLLLCSTESALKDFEKARLREIRDDETVLTKSFSGRSARGIRNSFIDQLDKRNDIILPYPYQNKLTGELRRHAKSNGNLDLVSIWVGKSIRHFGDQSTKEILTDLIAEAESIIVANTGYEH